MSSSDFDSHSEKAGDKNNIKKRLGDPMEASRLSALLVSRVCHDLASPVSSLTITIDALKDPDMAAQAEALVEKSAKSMEHQLTFLRYAFGSVGLQDGEADQHEVTRLLTEYAALNKCQVEWSGDAQTLTLKQSRLLMNMAMIGMTTVPRAASLHSLTRLR